MTARKVGYLQKPAAGKSGQKRKLLKYVLWGLLTLVLLMVLVSIAMAFALPKIFKTPDLDTLLKEKPYQVSRVYADNGEIVGEFIKENRIPVSIKKMPVDLKNAIVATEDKNFYQHGGIDPMGIARAIIKNIETGRKSQGASTIPQQLARILYLEREKSYSRKIREWLIAIQISKKYSKDQVLELYLNRVYLGHGLYGVEAASNFYFGKTADKLSLAECALIAGLPQLPEVYSPFRNMAKAKARRAQVLDRMVEENYITKKQAQRAKLTPIYLSKKRENFSAGSYFVEQIRRQMVEDPNYGYQALYQEGLRIYTTMNARYQRVAQDVLQRHLEEFEKKQQAKYNALGKNSKGELKPNTTGYAKILKINSSTDLTVLIGGQQARLALPADLPYLKKENIVIVGNFLPVKILGLSSLKQPVIQFIGETHIQGALIAIDPHNGQVKVMIGGYDFGDSEYNRATQAYRQPGSAFKPIVYATAIDNGYAPTDRITDSQISFKNWTPQNYDHKWHGDVSLRYALEQSLNVPTVKLASQLGIDKIIEVAAKLGIRDTETRKMNRDLTLALGSLEVTPQELAAAYAVFANGGTWYQPEIMKYITDARGAKIDEYPSYSAEAMNPQTCYVITDMLKGVITKGTAAYSVGKYYHYPAAGKTGTTNDYSDAWFVGYTPDLVVCTWVGYDKRRPLGPGMTGGAVAAPIWRDFMLQITNDSTARDFNTMEGVTSADICSASGKLATSQCIQAADAYKEDPQNNPPVKIIKEVFKAGNEPKEYCNADHTQAVVEESSPEMDSESGESNVPMKAEP